MGEERKYTYEELTDKLVELGDMITDKHSMFVVGGYCLLGLNIRESTGDLDCVTDGLVIPCEFRDVINTDVLYVDTLDLKFDRLLGYAGDSVVYGNLTVYTASVELLLAMKFLAREGRIKQRDSEDLMALSEMADWKKAYKILCEISSITCMESEFIESMETELWLIQYSELTFAG